MPTAIDADDRVSVLDGNFTDYNDPIPGKLIALL